MKSAKMAAVGVELACPHCGEGFEAPNGSFMWEPHEVRGLPSTKTLTCGTCGERSRVPRSNSAALS